MSFAKILSRKGNTCPSFPQSTSSIHCLPPPPVTSPSPWQEEPSKPLKFKLLSSLLQLAPDWKCAPRLGHHRRMPTRPDGSGASQLIEPPGPCGLSFLQLQPSSSLLLPARFVISAHPPAKLNQPTESRAAPPPPRSGVFFYLALPLFLKMLNYWQTADERGPVFS